VDHLWQIILKHVPQLPFNLVLQESSDVGNIVKSRVDVHLFQRIVLKNQSYTLCFINDKQDDSSELDVTNSKAHGDNERFVRCKHSRPLIDS
jgi:hypothetical protein